MEDTNINIEKEQVFYTVWRRYPDLDFSFLGQEVVNEIEGFKAKLAEEATPIIDVPNDEVRQPNKEEPETMDEDEGRERSRETALRG